MQVRHEPVTKGTVKTRIAFTGKPGVTRAESQESAGSGV